MSRSSPTPAPETQNIDVRGATVQDLTDNSGESRVEKKGFDFAKYKSPNEAGNAYKQSDEHRENQHKLRTIDELIQAARKEISV